MTKYGELAIQIENVLRQAGQIRRAVPFDKAVAVRFRVKIIDFIKRARNVGYAAAEDALTQESGWLGDMISRY
jgi:hypothetical protein